MGKRKMTLLAQALVLVDSLNPNEQATLADYLRGKMPQARQTNRKPPKELIRKTLDGYSREKESTALSGDLQKGTAA